jgi:flagellar biosynthesis protein FlhG
VLVNQAARSGAGQAITHQLQQVLDRFVVTDPDRPLRLINMGEIPVDPEVRQAVMRRQLLMQTTPGCPAGVAIAQLARKLEESVIPKPA